MFENTEMPKWWIKIGPKMNNLNHDNEENREAKWIHESVWMPESTCKTCQRWALDSATRHEKCRLKGRGSFSAQVGALFKNTHAFLAINCSLRLGVFFNVRGASAKLQSKLKSLESSVRTYGLEHATAPRRCQRSMVMNDNWNCGRFVWYRSCMLSSNIETEC